MKDKLVRDVMEIGVPVCKINTSLPEISYCLFH